MEEDQIQMSHEELQKLIRKKVRTSRPMTLDVLDKCNLLKSLLEKRERQAEHLLRLCRSVSACEAIVKKQYSLLGWEYRDTDSDEDDEAKCSGKISPVINGGTPLLPKLQDNESLQKATALCLKRKPVVVLTRLSLPMVRSLCPPLEQDSENESLTGSDKLWEPEDNQSDSDVSITSNETRPKKRRKTEKTPAESPPTPQLSVSTNVNSNTTKTPAESPPTRQPSVSTNVNSNTTKTSAESPPTPQISVNTNVNSTTTKTPATTNGGTVSNTALSKTSSDNKKMPPPSVPQEELKENMTVIARKNSTTWLLGKIKELLTKAGRLKYKIVFEEKGKSLVSGYHIALDSMVKVDQLVVGSRVVVKRGVDQDQFRPGILAELPDRKNRMRFLVFFDDHTALYVGLPLLRLVARPLADPLDDIKDGDHKDFLRKYVKAWPYPPMNQYRVGQSIHLKLNGVVQRCEVQSVDSSLIQVVVLADQCQHWIYRGSSSLQLITPLKGTALCRVFTTNTKNA